MHLLVCYLNKLQNARCNDKDNDFLSSCLFVSYINTVIQLEKLDYISNSTYVGCIGLYRAVEGCIGLYRAVQVCIGLHRAA